MTLVLDSSRYTVIARLWLLGIGRAVVKEVQCCTCTPNHAGHDSPGCPINPFTEISLNPYLWRVHLFQRCSVSHWLFLWNWGLLGNNGFLQSQPSHAPYCWRVDDFRRNEKCTIFSNYFFTYWSWFHLLTTIREQMAFLFTLYFLFCSPHVILYACCLSHSAMISSGRNQG